MGRSYERVHQGQDQIPFDMNDLVEYTQRVQQTYMSLHNLGTNVPGHGPIFALSSRRDIARLIAGFLAKYNANSLAIAAAIVGSVAAIEKPEKAPLIFGISGASFVAGRIFKHVHDKLDARKPYEHRQARW